MANTFRGCYACWNTGTIKIIKECNQCKGTGKIKPPILYKILPLPLTCQLCHHGKIRVSVQCPHCKKR